MYAPPAPPVQREPPAPPSFSQEREPAGGEVGGDVEQRKKLFLAAIVFGVLLVAGLFIVFKGGAPPKAVDEKTVSRLAPNASIQPSAAARFLKSFEPFDYAGGGVTLELQQSVEFSGEERRDVLTIKNKGRTPASLYVVELIPGELRSGFMELSFAGLGSVVSLPLVVTRELNVAPGGQANVGFSSRRAENVGAIFLVTSDRNAAQTLQQFFEEKSGSGQASQTSVFRLSVEQANALSRELNRILSDPSIQDKRAAVEAFVRSFEAGAGVERVKLERGQLKLVAKGKADNFVGGALIEIPFFKSEGLGEVLLKPDGVKGELARYLVHGYPKLDSFGGVTSIQLLFNFKTLPVKNGLFWKAGSKTPLNVMQGELRVWFSKTNADDYASIPLAVEFTAVEPKTVSFVSPSQTSIVVGSAAAGAGSAFVAKPLVFVNNLPVRLEARVCGKQGAVEANSFSANAFQASPSKCGDDESKNWVDVRTRELERHLSIIGATSAVTEEDQEDSEGGFNFNSEEFRLLFYCERVSSSGYCVNAPDFVKGITAEDAVAPAFSYGAAQSEAAKWKTCSDYYCDCAAQKDALADFKAVFDRRLDEVNALNWPSEALEQVVGRELSQTTVVRTSSEKCGYADFPAPFNALALDSGGVYAVKLSAPVSSEFRGYDLSRETAEATEVMPKWSFVKRGGEIAQNEAAFSIYVLTTDKIRGSDEQWVG